MTVAGHLESELAMGIGALEGLGSNQVAVSRGVTDQNGEDFATHLERAQEQKEPKTTETPEEIKLREACEELSSFFVSYLLKQMRATIPQSDLFPGGGATEIYEEMFDGELAKKIAKSDSFSLSSVLYDQLKNANDIDDRQG